MRGEKRKDYAEEERGSLLHIILFNCKCTKHHIIWKGIISDRESDMRWWWYAGRETREWMMHAWSCYLTHSFPIRLLVWMPGKIAESRTRIKNHRPCPVASLLMPRHGASVLLNRIHHNWYEKHIRTNI